MHLVSVASFLARGSGDGEENESEGIERGGYCGQKQRATSDPTALSADFICSQRKSYTPLRSSPDSFFYSYFVLQLFNLSFLSARREKNSGSPLPRPATLNPYLL